MAQILRELDRKEIFELPTGGKFTIKADVTGLYVIDYLSGGNAPPITGERFTTINGARKRIESYIESKTKVVYPDRGPETSSRGATRKSAKE